MAVHYGAPPEKEQIHSPAEQSPFWAIGRLLMSDGAHWYVGSGSLIAPAFVLTAGHVLQGKVAGTVTFGYDITDLAGNATRTVAIAAAAIPANYGVQGWDIGVARLAADYNRTSGFVFNPQGQGADRATALNMVKPGVNITIAGYPGAGVSVSPTEHPVVALGHMYAKSGPLYACDFPKNRVQYQFDTRGGESGSPLYNQPNGRVQQIGVHTNWNVVHDKQAGEGTLITDAVLAWIGRAVAALAGAGPFVRPVA